MFKTTKKDTDKVLNVEPEEPEVLLTESDEDKLTTEQERVFSFIERSEEFASSLGNVVGVEFKSPFPASHLIGKFLDNYPSANTPKEFQLAEILYYLSLCSYNRFYYHLTEVDVSGEPTLLRTNIMAILNGPSGKGKTKVIGGARSFSSKLSEIPRIPTQQEIDSGEINPVAPGEVPISSAMLSTLGDNFSVEGAREILNECRNVYCIKDEISPFLTYSHSNEAWKSEQPTFIMGLYSNSLSEIVRSGGKTGKPRILRADNAYCPLLGATTPASLVHKLKIKDLTDGFGIRYMWFPPKPGMGYHKNVGKGIKLNSGDPKRSKATNEVGLYLVKLYKHLSRGILNDTFKRVNIDRGIRLCPDDQASQLYDQFQDYLDNTYPEGFVTLEDKNDLDSMDIKLLEHTLKLAMLFTLCRPTFLGEVDRVLEYRKDTQNWKQLEIDQEASPESVIFIDQKTMQYAIDITKNYLRPNVVELYLAIKSLDHAGLTQIIKQIMNNSSCRLDDDRAVLLEKHLMKNLNTMLGDKYQPRIVKECINHLVGDLGILESYVPSLMSPNRILILNPDHSIKGVN